jgi:hypothetical protein
VDISEAISGLSPTTSYDFRITASRVGGGGTIQGSN